MQAIEDFSKEKNFYNYRSGGEIPESYFAVADKYGRIVTPSNGYTMIISVDEEYKNNSEKLKYSPILEGFTSFESFNGAFKVTDV